jgi:iron(III) transport system ATP-binding protein
MSSIKATGIRKAFGAVEILKGVDLDIADGEFFTLLGPSGCGKTTLLRIVAGLAEADSGSLKFDTDEVSRLPAHRRGVGMVFQDYALFPHRTVFDNVAYGLRARRLDTGEIARRVEEYLAHVGLTGLERRYPNDLSGGQRQRTALARAMVVRPRVLLMDEPLSNLDAKLRAQLREAIRDLQRRLRTTTIFVTHDQDEALSMSDRIAVMDRGNIVQVGTPRDLYASPANAYVASFVGSANVLPVDAISARACGQLAVRVGGIELQCRDARRGVAGPAALIARPEQLSLGDETAAGAMQGRVLRRAYFGGKTLLRILTASRLELTVEQWSHRLGDVAEGDAVSVLFPSNLDLVPA